MCVRAHTHKHTGFRVRGLGFGGPGVRGLGFGARGSVSWKRRARGDKRGVKAGRRKGRGERGRGERGEERGTKEAVFRKLAAC